MLLGLEGEVARSAVALARTEPVPFRERQRPRYEAFLSLDRVLLPAPRRARRCPNRTQGSQQPLETGCARHFDFMTSTIALAITFESVEFS